MDTEIHRARLAPEVGCGAVLSFYSLLEFMLCGDRLEPAGRVLCSVCLLHWPKPRPAPLKRGLKKRPRP